MVETILKLQQKLQKNTAILLCTEAARRYVTGFHSSLGYVFITSEKTTALFDSRYIEAATAGVFEGIEVLLLKNLQQQGQALLEGVSKLLVETTLSVREFRAFQKLFSVPVEEAEWVTATVEQAREIKTEWELSQICQAQQYAEQAFEQVLHFIKPGVTERQIAAELEYCMKRCGSEDAAFQTITVAGSKTSLPHGVPGNQKVAKGDFITMDFGAVSKGYRSDMTRTVAVGFATDEMKNVYDTVLAANLAAEKVVAAGVLCSTVDAAARNLIKNAGYGDCFGHGTGHGVGLDIHEAPTVGPKNSQPLAAGQIITVEPGIYLPGKFGVRIEDMLFVTKNGANNLTNTKKSLIIL